MRWEARRDLRGDKFDKIEGSSTGGSVALFGQQSSAPKRREKKKRDISDVTCFGCGQKGHLRRNCPTKKDKPKDDKPKGEAAKTDATTTATPSSKVGCGGVSWKSKKQTCVALSSTEAEYVALFQVAKECEWMLGFLKGLGA